MPMVRKHIAAVLLLASRWPLLTACAFLVSLALCYQSGTTADAPSPSGRFQVHRTADGIGTVDGFDTATGLECMTVDPRGADSLYRVSKLRPFCVDLLNDRTLPHRMQQRLPY
jgi:hypothetical protein